MAFRSLPGIGSSLSTASRAADVVATLAKFGFGEFLRQTSLDTYLSRSDSGEEAHARKPLPVRVRLLLEALGPTFVKGGQVMSTRPDLIPPEWIAEFRKLQTEVPPDEWDGEDGVRAVLEAELGERLGTAFQSIDEAPIAAASMAQVHRAVLIDGRPVVVKILRPGIREKMAADLELMRIFARLTQSHFENLGFDAEAVIDEFSKQLRRETDLTIEAHSTQRMRTDFEDHPGISFPRVEMGLSTRSVLVMEEAKGTLLSRLDLAALSDEQRGKIIRNGADMVFKQTLVIGFFHADPHPGNIFVGEDQSLIFIDCGMTGLVDPGTIQQLARITHGALEGELNTVIRVAISIADADPAIADDRSFRSDVWHFVDRFHGGTLSSLSMGSLLNEFFTLLRKHRLRCPSDIVYLMKALTTIEGVAEDIAPSFDLVTYVRPYVEQLVRQQYSSGTLRRRMRKTIIAYGDFIEELPREVSDLLRSLRHNRLSINLEHRGIREVTDEIERASVNVAWFLFIAAMIVSSSVLILADNLDDETSNLTTLATIAFIIAIILGFIRLMLSWWASRRNN